MSFNLSGIESVSSKETLRLPDESEYGSVSSDQTCQWNEEAEDVHAPDGKSGHEGFVGVVQNTRRSHL